ncbi:MAG TPA: 4Fe-4S dicluster domain-containing protein, partial [Kofleriaceae bacterium]|nr:4Fe-4S dicluster domain-containing protein [Kofleriaceae bacterium]
DVAAVAVALAAAIAAGGGSIATLPPALVARAGERLGPAHAWVDRLAADLLAHRGAGAIVVGDRQPAAVHALARWIEAACGDHGGPVAFSEPAIAEPLGGDSLASLARALATGQVGALVVLDVDPVRTAPPALALEAAFARAPFSLCLAAYPSRTARACRAFAPLAHELETWGDGRAWDGTLSIAQPACRPRFDVLAPLDVLAVLAGDGRDARAIVRDQHRGLDDAAWTDALRAGVVAGSRAPRIAPAPLPAAFPAELSDGLATALAAGGAGTLEVALAASPQLRDGRFAANAWLQELPHPITKQTWGNGALMSRATAHALHVGDGELLLVETDAGAAALPAVLVDGAADGSITIEVGHGARDRALPIADRVGADAYPLRTGDSLLATGRAHRTGGVGRVIRTQTTMTEHGRETTPLATLAGFLAAPDLTAHLRGDPPSMLPARAREGVQWGMSIDTSSCTGCGACMIACQAENNVPSVGPDDVARGRHMGWLRVDRYQHAGGVAVNQPVPCQHCEDAPCEYVCPVEATVHSPDGLNEQVYNRCVGTRFCSNNCPYKVRRFNWFAYERRGSDALQYNPDVTVRSRGVMEKCTYCVQRIRRAEQTALVEDREPAPGEVVTACQQACPTAAIQFGRLDEEGTAFAAMRRDPRRFDLLHDLGARPRTQYLAAIRNPGPRR